MKKAYLVCIFFILLTSQVFSAVRTAKIFMVNLYKEKVDVQLGEDVGFVYQMTGLDSYSSSTYVTTSSYGDYKLYFKISSDENWFFLAADNEKPVMCTVSSSKLYAIIIDEKGKIRFIECDDSFSKGAKVSFFNGSFDIVNTMKIGLSWDVNPAAYVSELDPYSITNMGSIPPSEYNLFWQFPYQVENDNYFFYPDETGNSPMLHVFEANKYYLFLVYTVEDNEYANLFCISPK